MDIQYLIRFEEKMQDDLLRLATTRGMLKGVLLATEDDSVIASVRENVNKIMKDYPLFAW